MIAFLFYWWRLKQQEKRYKKRFVQQVARNITIAPSGGAIPADKLAEEIKHIGDHNGKIKKQDLKNWMADGKLGEISNSDFEALWAAMDIDGTGEVNAIQFCVFLSGCGDAFDEVYEEQKHMSDDEKAKLASRRLSVLNQSAVDKVHHASNTEDP